MQKRRITAVVSLLFVLALALGALTACDDSEEIVVPPATIISATEEAVPAETVVPGEGAYPVATEAPQAEPSAYPAAGDAAGEVAGETADEFAYPGAADEVPYPIE
jgi:hypothetical protein